MGRVRARAYELGSVDRLVHSHLLTMTTIKIAGSLASIALGLLVTCCASPQETASSPQPVVPRTETEGLGVTNAQTVADEDVILRVSSARCDRSQSCDHIGPGAIYRDRDDCMAQMRTLVSKQLNTSQCPGGIGETGVSRCVKSLHLGECDMPGQVYTTVSHCKLEEMCLK